VIVEKRRLGEDVLLVVEGVIREGETASFFAGTLERSLQEGRGRVLIDLSRIRLMDSTGLGELVSYLGRLEERQRQLLLINPSDTIRELLRTSRLDALFSTHDSLEAALAVEI